MGAIGDLALPHDPRGAFERVRQPQQPSHQPRLASAFLEVQHALDKVVLELARFGAKIEIRIARHASGGRLRLDEAQQIARQASELRHRIERLTRADFCLTRGLGDIGDRGIDLLDRAALLLGRKLVASPVLVVDDDPLVRDTTANWLREFGYEVLEADSGPSALAILDGNSKIDILVTDLVMPGMHGYALASEARLRRPGIPVILITGYTGFASETGLDEREFPILHKPFRPSELAGIMMSCLRN
jgi:CheY-like chemotaxis protein